MSTGQNASVEQFRQAVAAAVGPDWRVEPTADGFRAVRALSPTTDGDVSSSDDAVMEVAVDEAARTFTIAARRSATERIDRSESGWGVGGFHASRESGSVRYSGSRRTAVFRRTPDGLVPDASAPADTAGRAADIARVGTELGFTDATPAAPGVPGWLTPKRLLVGVAVFFGVVVLAIVGIMVAVGVGMAGLLGG